LAVDNMGSKNTSSNSTHGSSKNSANPFSSSSKKSGDFFHGNSKNLNNSFKKSGSVGIYILIGLVICVLFIGFIQIMKK